MAKGSKKASKRTKLEERGSKKRRRSAIGTIAEEDGLEEISTSRKKGTKKKRSSL